MRDPSRRFVDRLLVRAWIQPDHQRKLRVLVRTAPDAANERQRAFADADLAAAFVRDWLIEFVRRWERGEGAEPVDGRAFEPLEEAGRMSPEERGNGP